MNNGWIKIHRKIIEKGYYKKSKYVHLWIHLLLKANHKENEFFFNNKILKIKRGQFVTGRKKLSEETGINESSVERILKMLENEQQIKQQKTNLFRIITVINYDIHQVNEQQIEQPVNNKRTTSEQPVNTNKNEKNEKNESVYKHSLNFPDLKTFKEEMLKDSDFKKYDLEYYYKIVSLHIRSKNVKVNDFVAYVQKWITLDGENAVLNKTKSSKVGILSETDIKKLFKIKSISLIINKLVTSLKKESIEKDFYLNSDKIQVVIDSTVYKIMQLSKMNVVDIEKNNFTSEFEPIRNQLISILIKSK